MKCSNKRGAIEIASSTVVLIIIGIIILITSLGLTYQVVCGAEKIREDVDSQTQERIERLMGNSGTVFVADNTKTAKIKGSVICGSSRRRIASFDVGVRNTVSDQPIRISYQVNLLDGTSLTPQQRSELVSGTQYSTRGSWVTVSPGQTYVGTVVFAVPTSIQVPQLQYEVTVQYQAPGILPDVLGSQLLYLQLE